MKKIVFVCTGNTCRSPMAEAFFKHAVKDDEVLLNQYHVLSTGIAALNGSPASVNSIKALNDGWNIDISAHKSRSLSESDINEADLILTMTVRHKDAVLSSFPAAKSKVYTLKEYIMHSSLCLNAEECKYKLDIDDPYGASLYVYKTCAIEIKEAVDRLIEKLKNGFK